MAIKTAPEVVVFLQFCEHSIEMTFSGLDDPGKMKIDAVRVTWRPEKFAAGRVLLAKTYPRPRQTMI